MTRHDIIIMRHNIIEASEQEAQKLYRMRWRAKAHGVSKALEHQILDEATWLHMIGTVYPERIIQRVEEDSFKFAFK